MVWRLVCCALALVALASPRFAAAQVVVQLQPFEQTGLFVSAGGGAIVIDVLGQKYAAQVDSKELNVQTVFELKGNAYPSVLQAGTYVRFPAKLDAKKRRIVAPIDKLTIFSATPDTRFGAFGDEVIAPDGPDAPARVAIAGGGGGNDSFVVGQISRARKNEIVVQIPEGKLEGKLADNVAIDVSVTDKALGMRMLRPGDQVHVVGGHPADMLTKVFAQRIVATLARPLGEEPSAKKPPRQTADGGDKVASPDPAAINPDEDFGAAATAAAEEASAEPPLAAKPTRARILKVN